MLQETSLNGSSFILPSRGRPVLTNGERYSYALGNGKYLLLEEVSSKKERNPSLRGRSPDLYEQPSASVKIQARDFSNDKKYLAMDDSTLRTIEMMSTPFGHRGSRLSLKTISRSPVR